MCRVARAAAQSATAANPATAAPSRAAPAATPACAEVAEANVCPICLTNSDDATVSGRSCGLCVGCGQLFCGECLDEFDEHGKFEECPMCRQHMGRSDEARFAALKQLIHTRDEGRHTPHALSELALMHAQGAGTAADPGAAARLYRQAAAKGHRFAQWQLARAYRSGSGVPQDAALSFKYCSLAAEQGDANAWRALAEMYARPASPAVLGPCTLRVCRTSTSTPTP